MPRQKKPQYKQTTLINFLSSSPPRPNTRSRAKTKATNHSALVNRAEHSSALSRTQAKAESFELVSDESSAESDVARIQFEPVKTMQGTGNASTSQVVTKVRTKQPSRIITSDDEEGGMEESKTSTSHAVVNVVSPSKRKNLSQSTDARDSDSDVNIPVRRRRVIKRSSSSSDEEDLMDGIDDEKIVDSRLRSRGLTKFQQNLERLKRKKRGDKALASDDDTANYDNESLSDAQPFEDARPDNTSEINESDADSEGGLDSFIVDDSINTSQHVTLPAAFSMNVHQDLAHHFKVICQYFVHLALSSARNKSSTSKRLLDDEYFSLPLSIVRRKLSGVRDSVASSKWRSSFVRSLKSLPDFALSSLDFAVPQCDACHLGGRMSTYIGRLGGAPYDPATFQTIRDSDSDEESDDNEDSDEEKREFHLGRFCARRTKTYHELSHWEFALYTQLREELRLVQRLNESRRSRSSTSDASPEPTNGDEYMEKLDRRGVIDSEWEKIRELMERATNLDAEAD